MQSEQYICCISLIIVIKNISIYLGYVFIYLAIYVSIYPSIYILTLNTFVEHRGDASFHPYDPQALAHDGVRPAA